MSETAARNGHDGEQVLELYRLSVEMADRVSARRASANSYFFTVQAGLAIALGAFAVRPPEGEDADPDRFVLALAALAGVVIAGAWWLLLRSYRDLNAAKFEVIGRIESQHLPIQTFNDEWDHLKGLRPERWKLGYSEQGRIERAVPLAFLALYATLVVYVILN
ncbi:RipA family octameric membrane protein [Candidatus Poriferisodalis sp.]|uniref:RipA family octameric membrane protein n=1 Tax=Candidatus Poriferisodalis sp. TaxID=3101277 RepID=UPI003B0130D0